MYLPYHWPMWVGVAFLIFSCWCNESPHQRSRLDKCGSCCIKPMANRVHFFGLAAGPACTHFHYLTHRYTRKWPSETWWLRAKTHGLSQNISNRYEEAVCRVTSGNGNSCAQAPAISRKSAPQLPHLSNLFLWSEVSKEVPYFLHKIAALKTCTFFFPVTSWP